MLALGPSCSIVLSLSSASAKENLRPLARAKQCLLSGRTTLSSPQQSNRRNLQVNSKMQVSSWSDPAAGLDVWAQLRPVTPRLCLAVYGRLVRPRHTIDRMFGAHACR